MLLGRLEVFTLLVLFTPMFWRLPEVLEDAENELPPGGRTLLPLILWLRSVAIGWREVQRTP